MDFFQKDNNKNVFPLLKTMKGHTVVYTMVLQKIYP